MGWQPNVDHCGRMCRQRFPSTRWLAYSRGRGHTSGHCYCEKTQHCYHRNSSSSWDAWYNGNGMFSLLNMFTVTWFAFPK